MKFQEQLRRSHAVPLKHAHFINSDVDEPHVTPVMEYVQKLGYVLERCSHACAHELKEPIRNVASFMYLLACRNEMQCDEESLQYMILMRQNIDRIRTLTNDLAYYLQLMNQAEDNNIIIDLNSVLYDITEKLRNRLLEKKATITVATLPAILGVPAHVHRLFFNLIDNALKFCTNVAPCITVFVHEHEQCWEFYVKDNGIGIEHEYHQSIFNMFSRLHTHDHYEGSGLGLALCKEIAHQHHGTIDVHSVIGHGSEFRVTLPKLKV